MSASKSKSCKSAHYCAIRCCKNNSSNCNVSFYRFPKDLDRAKIWAIQCGREELLEKLEHLYQNYRVCGAHFEKRMFRLNDLRNRLQPYAVPVILLKQDGSSPTTASTEEIQNTFYPPLLTCDLPEHKTSCNEILVVDLPVEFELPELKFEPPELKFEPPEVKFEPPEHLCNCTECSYEAELSFQLDHHVQKKHNIPYMAQVFHATTELEKFSCCSYTSQFMCDLYEHYKHAHELKDGNHKIALFRENSQKYLCNSCKFESDSGLLFVKHQDLCKFELQADAMQCVDPDAGMESTDLEPAGTIKYCGECAYSTVYKGHLKRHKRMHNRNRGRNKWLSCKHCSYRAKHPSGLKEHDMLKHARDEEINWFQCSHCPYRGKLKGYLKKHMLKHVPNEECIWFPCSSCKYRTNKKSNLKIHMLKHASKEEINWFQCNQCSYKAKHKTSLKKHMLQHASDYEINWFQCDICSHRTKRKGDLKLHRWRHTTKDALLKFA